MLGVVSCSTLYLFSYMLINARDVAAGILERRQNIGKVGEIRRDPVPRIGILNDRHDVALGILLVLRGGRRRLRVRFFLPRAVLEDLLDMAVLRTRLPEVTSWLWAVIAGHGR